MTTTPTEILLTEWRPAEAGLRGLRRQVFVDEQGVPEELEWDGLDADAVHALARDVEGRVIGTGRLLADGQIGRMAVLSGHRRRGVGSGILERLVAAARERGLDRVYLHAQVAVLPFYRFHGFVAEGGEFVEAGIPHRLMSRDLAAGRPAGKAASLTGLLRGARHSLEVFLRRLDKELIDDPALLDAAQQLLLAHPSNRLRICVQTVDGARAACPRLFALLARLPSRIELRLAGELQRDRQENFALVDRNRYLRRISPVRHDWHGGEERSEVDRLAALFDEIWSSAEAHPELRTLDL